MKTIRPLHIFVFVLLLNLTSAAFAGKYALVSTPVNDTEVS